MENTITCRINYKYRIAVKPRNMVCFRYIIVGTLYKDEKLLLLIIIIIPRSRSILSIDGRIAEPQSIA